MLGLREDVPFGIKGEGGPWFWAKADQGAATVAAQLQPIGVEIARHMRQQASIQIDYTAGQFIRTTYGCHIEMSGCEWWYLEKEAQLLTAPILEMVFLPTAEIELEHAGWKVDPCLTDGGMSRGKGGQ